MGNLIVVNLTYMKVILDRWLFYGIDHYLESSLRVFEQEVDVRSDELVFLDKEFHFEGF
jgi:hypothetical protein